MSYRIDRKTIALSFRDIFHYTSKHMFVVQLAGLLTRHYAFLSEDKQYDVPLSTDTVSHAFITFRIDYCNSLLYDMSDYNKTLLQIIQNSAARIIMNTKKYDCITPVLRNLHCLPVRYRIQNKILLITYKAITGPAPD